MEDKYAILGIQAPESPKDSTTSLVARVRMFIGDEVVDEDFDLPELPPSVPATEDVFGAFLRSDIEARVLHLEGQR